MNLTLSSAQVDQVIEEAKAEIVSRLIGEAGEVRLLSPTQTSSIRYRLADVRSYIEKNRK